MCMAWYEVECGHDVEWCAEMWWSGLMWIMVRCEMWWCVCEMWCDVECQLQFQTWCDVVCDWNAKCVMWNMMWCGIWHPGMWNIAQCKMWKVTMWCDIIVTKNVAYTMCCVIVARCQMWKMMQCVAMSDVVVWCKIKMWWCNMWNMVWCEMCCDVNVGVVWNSCGCGMVWDVDCGCVMWNCCALRCGGVKWWWEADCDVMWIWWSEVIMCCNIKCGVENVVMWCGMLCNNGVVWNGVTWKVVWCKIFQCGVMECAI